MRLLACSDIHNNVEAILQLRSQESNDFDAVLAAGDLGSESAAEILNILDTFACPVYFVLGNWDNRLEYFSLDRAQRHQIHLNGFELGSLYITGFSGCPAGWGMNPQAQMLLRQIDQAYQALLKSSGRLKTGISTEDAERYKAARAVARKQALSLNRAKLTEILTADPERAKRTIVLTHERLFKLEGMGSPFLHIHGHLHSYKQSFYQGSHIFNVACLDPGTSALQSASRPNRQEACGYSIITIGKNRAVTTERKALAG